MKLKGFIFPISLFVLIWFVYHDLFLTFYQQDEWMALGHFFTEGLGAFLSVYSPLSLIGGGGRLLAQPIYYIIYTLFPFQVGPFMAFAIILHFLNSLLLFFLIKKITKNNLLALISSLFFATSSVLMQGVSWISASVNTLPSALFVIVSLYFYFKFLDNFKKKFLYLSFLSSLVSYFFKESSIFIFILLPLIYIIFSKRKVKLWDLIKVHWIILAYAIIAIIARISDLFLNFRGTASFVIENNHPWQKILLNIFFYPIESFSQSFIYPGFMWNLSEMLLKINYPRLASTNFFVVLRETIAADFISIILSFIFFSVLFIVYLRLKEYRKLIIFALLFTFLSFLPFVVLDKGNAYLDSRYFYMGVAGAGILFAIFIESLRRMFDKIFGPRLGIAIVLIIPFVYFAIQVKIIRNDIREQIILSDQKVKFLSDLKNYLPNFSPKSIIYITGDTSFYAPNNKTPLQEGPGFTLMVWYYKDGGIPKDLIAKNFLWDINSEGYRSAGNGGFGYFYDLEKLNAAVRDEHLDKKTVFGFYYKGSEMKLINMTSDIRKRL